VIKLVEEIGKRTTNITADPKETAYLFQQLSLSMALQRGNVVSSQSTLTASSQLVHCNPSFSLLLNVSVHG